MHHKSRRLLIRHDGYVRNLHPFRLVRHIHDDVGHILRLHRINTGINGCRFFLIPVKAYFAERRFHNARLNGGHLDIRGDRIHANTVTEGLNRRLRGTVNGSARIRINTGC